MKMQQMLHAEFVARMSIKYFAWLTSCSIFCIGFINK